MRLITQAYLGAEICAFGQVVSFNAHIQWGGAATVTVPETRAYG
ncbi:hypothetical protein [Catellatospora tritici]|nr:hypothetical protein [Catellatospora tritici]